MVRPSTRETCLNVCGGQISDRAPNGALARIEGYTYRTHSRHQVAKRFRQLPLRSHEVAVIQKEILPVKQATNLLHGKLNTKLKQGRTSRVDQFKSSDEKSGVGLP